MKYLYEHFHLWCVTNVRKEKYSEAATRGTGKRNTNTHKTQGWRTTGWQTEAVAAAVTGACRVAIIMMIIIAVKHATRASRILHLPSAISLTLETFIINTHTHTYIPAYLLGALLVFALLFPTHFPFSAFSFFHVQQNYYILITHALAALAAPRQKQTTRTTAKNQRWNVNENGVKNQFHGFYAAVYCCKREPYCRRGTITNTHTHSLEKKPKNNTHLHTLGVYRTEVVRVI